MKDNKRTLGGLGLAIAVLILVGWFWFKSKPESASPVQQGGRSHFIWIPSDELATSAPSGQTEACMEQAIEQMRDAFRKGESSMQMCGHYKFEVFNGLYIGKDGRPTYEDPNAQ